MISIIVACSKNRIIGNKGKIPWHIPDDLKRFKQITTGHPVIMGRKTFESILDFLGKPLPDRTNIIVTRNGDYTVPEGCIVCTSLDEAVSKANEIDNEESFVIGGGEIYKEALPKTDKIYLTLIDKEFDGDTYFPSWNDFKEISKEVMETDEFSYSFITLEKD